MFKALLAALPIAMFAQTYTSSIAITPNAFASVNPNVAMQIQSSQFSDAAETAAQIAQLANSVAKTASIQAQGLVNSYQQSSLTESMITNARFTVELASSLASELQNQTNTRYSKLTTTTLENANTLLAQVTEFRSSTDTNLAREVSASAYRLAQYAAQTAQEIAFSNPSRTTTLMAKAAMSNAQSAGITAQVASRTNETFTTISSRASNLNPNMFAQDIIRAQSAEIFANNNQLSYGNPNADVTIVEFNDYNCTYCKQMNATIDQATRLDPSLRVIVKEAPVISQESRLAAKAAIAAKRQGQYLNYRNLLSATTLTTTPSVISNAARTLGLNQASFQADINNPALDAYLARNLDLARTLGLQTTPTIIVSKNNGQYSQVVTGAVDLTQLKSIIADVRNSSSRF